MAAAIERAFRATTHGASNDDPNHEAFSSSPR
jgi:hypothetical protein